MKRIACVMLGLLVLGIPLFAGGGSQAAKPQDGLTTLKVWGKNGIASANNQTVRLSDLYDGTVKNRIWDQIVADLAARGIKLEMTLVMEDQLITAFQTLLASGRLNEYDWVAPSVDFRTRLSLVEQKRIMPLNQVIRQYSAGPARDYYFNNPIGTYFAKMDTLEDGNFYWLTQNLFTYYGDPSRPAGVAFLGMIRQDWLTKLGLPMPKTLDEFYNTLTAFQQRDVNGNGIKDEVAEISIENFNHGISEWFGLGGELISYIDYKAVSPWYQPRIKDYISYMGRLYKAGLLKTTEGGDPNSRAYMANYSGEYWEERNITVPAGAAKPYLTPIVIQAYPDTPARVYACEVGHSVFWGSAMCAVPAGSKNIEKVAVLIDYLRGDERRLLFDYGIEGYSFNYASDGSIVVIPSDSHNSVGIPGDTMFPGMSGVFKGWGTIFPDFRQTDRTTEPPVWQALGREMGYADGFQLRTDFFNDFHNNKYLFTQDGATLLTFPTAKEIDRTAQITPDLETYSKELLAALIMGEKSLDNWNTYMADLKRLGLDELIAINQARINRGR